MELRQELRDRSKIEYWANKYNVTNDTCIETLVPEVEQRGHLTKCELIEVSNWVLQRAAEGVRQYRVGRVKKNNSPDNVQTFTGNAFLSTNDSHSIRCLEQNLYGVGETIASAILHWFHELPYPTWTPHAKWAWGIHEDSFTSMRWQEFVDRCRGKAEKYEVSMRTLDRAFRECGKANML